MAYTKNEKIPLLENWARISAQRRRREQSRRQGTVKSQLNQIVCHSKDKKIPLCVQTVDDNYESLV